MVIIKTFYDFDESQIRARCARSLLITYWQKRWCRNHKTVLWYSSIRNPPKIPYMRALKWQVPLCLSRCRKKYYMVRVPYGSMVRTFVLHCLTYKNIPVSTWPKNILSQRNTSTPWQFLPPSRHHLVHQKFLPNPRSATIDLTATPPVRFVSFLEKSHRFYSANFVTWQPSQRVGRNMAIMDMYVVF